MHRFIATLPNYSAVALMNDYQHILDYHCRNCKIYLRVQQCLLTKLQKEPIEKSICVQRNYRNRSKYTDNTQDLVTLYFGFQDITEINIQQMLDSIYSHLIYGFDLIRLSPDNEKKLKQTMGNIIREDRQNHQQSTKLDIIDMKDKDKNSENSLSKINLKFLKPTQDILDKREMQHKLWKDDHLENNKFLTCVNSNNKPVECI